MSRKHKFTAGAVALATAAGAGGAVAATSSTSSPRQQFLGDAATRLHVTEPQLASALKSAGLDRLNAEVAAGKLTQAQARHIEARIGRGATPFLRFGQHRRALRSGVIRAAAGYLGLTPKELRTERQGGRSLAQIAQSQGKTVSGLEAAITAAVKTRLDHAVLAKRITAAQEQRVLAALPRRLERLVNRTS